MPALSRKDFDIYWSQPSTSVAFYKVDWLLLVVDSILNYKN